MIKITLNLDDIRDIVSESVFKTIQEISGPNINDINISNIDYNILKDIDIHIHMPSGGIPKDGPSAGIAITTALLSVFKGITIKNSIAFTGEITLKGSIRPVGNVKDKIIGSIKNNINTIFIPFENINDINTLPKEILEKVEIIPVKEYMEIYNYIMRKKDKK